MTTARSFRIVGAWRSALAVSGVCAALACQSNNAVPDAAGTTTATGSDLHFDDADLLRVSPGARATISVSGSGPEPVRVWLDGAYLDGSLDESVVSLDGGSANVTLSAPTSTTTFTVRARQGETSILRDVAISATGLATIRVHPKYSGNRPHPSYVASVFVGRECTTKDLLAFGISDGTPRVESPDGTDPVLTGVLAGSPLAVLTRVEHYLVGCKQLAPLQANSVDDVDVELFNQTLNMSDPFAIDLAFEPDGAEATSWHDALTPIADGWLERFLPAGTVEPAWLLDAMVDSAASTDVGAGTQFSTNRASGNWDTIASNWLTAHTPTIRTRTSSALSGVTTTPPTPLTIHVRPELVTGHAAVDAVSWAGVAIDGDWLDASAAEFTWTADPDDVLRLAGTMLMQQGSLMALGTSLASAPQRDLAAGLAAPQGIDCTGFAQALVGNGTSYATCTADCTRALCENALRLRATAATNGLNGATTPLSFAITSSAQPMISPDAHVQNFTGTWSGTVQRVNPPFGLHGTLTGAPL